eukprot:321319-Prorocentrum_minimum.AAC.1
MWLDPLDALELSPPPSAGKSPPPAGEFAPLEGEYDDGFRTAREMLPELEEEDEVGLHLIGPPWEYTHAGGED